jgi:two-component system NtrC family sensor kinase
MGEDKKKIGSSLVILKMIEDTELKFIEYIIRQTTVTIERLRVYTHLEGSLQEFKKAQRLWVHAEKMVALGELGAGIAHEINNPLCCISNYLQLLLQSEEEVDTKMASYLKAMENSANRIKDIVNNFLNFVQPVDKQSKKPSLNINSILDATTSLVEGLEYFKKIKIIKEYFPDVPAISGNETQIMEAFLNLFNNAKDAMPSGGDLYIRTEPHDHSIRVIIKDTGMGIKEENIIKIFDPFFTTKGPAKGTGLGLSATYGIIHNHSGNIQVESKVGKGTTFIIDLPIN